MGFYIKGSTRPHKPDWQWASKHLKRPLIAKAPFPIPLNCDAFDIQSMRLLQYICGEIITLKIIFATHGPKLCRIQESNFFLTSFLVGLYKMLFETFIYGSTKIFIGVKLADHLLFNNAYFLRHCKF